MKPVKISDGVFSLRVNRHSGRRLAPLVAAAAGAGCNAYLVKGSAKTALIDSVEGEHADVLFDYLRGEKPDYIVSSNSEQDHSGAIPLLLARYPRAKVVTNRKGKELLMAHLRVPAGKFTEAGDGESLPLGGRALEFIYTPWAHWPETMSTYLRGPKCLFSGNLFGSCLCTDQLISDTRSIYEPMKRYFSQVLMPHRASIKTHLQRFAGYETDLIAPGHGPVHSDAGFVMAAYREWVFGEPHNKTLVAYVSTHGSTYMLVNRLANRLQEAGVCVDKINLDHPDDGSLAMSLMDATSIVLGTPTVLAGPHPKVIYGAYLANLLRPKAKFVSVVGSFGWGGRTLETISGLIPNLKAKLLKPVMVKGLPEEADLVQIDELAALIAQKHSGLPAAVCNVPRPIRAAYRGTVFAIPDIGGQYT